MAKRADIGSQMDYESHTYQQLPTARLRLDRNHPRKVIDAASDAYRLQNSIERYGILQPLIVMRADDGRYTIIDGQRRWKAAQALRLDTVPAIMYPPLKPAELAVIRFDLQYNHLPGKPSERSHALQRLKRLMGFTRNEQLAGLVGVSKSLVGNSLQLQTVAIDLSKHMERYGLSESYRIEFIRLKPKIRQVGPFTVQNIVDTLLQRIQDHVIRNAKDLRTLGGVFARASANEAALTRFLADPDMTVAELAHESSPTPS